MADETKIKVAMAPPATPKVALSADIVAKQQSMGPAGAAALKIDRASCYEPVVRSVDWPPGRPVSQGNLYVMALTCDFHQAQGSFGYREAVLTFTFVGQTRLHDAYLASPRADQTGDRTIGIDHQLTFVEAGDSRNLPHWKEIYQLAAPVTAASSHMAGADSVAWSLNFEQSRGMATARVRQTGLFLIEVPGDERKLGITLSLNLTLDTGSPLGHIATAGPQTFEADLPEHAQEHDPSAWH